MKTLSIHGAYGRTYQSKKEAVRDWEQGKDFRVFGGPYLSSRDSELLVERYDKVVIETEEGYVRVL